LEKQILAALALALVVAAAVAVYRGMEPGHQDDVAATERQETLERGALVYVEHCASCHGNYGEGTSVTDGPPVRGTQLTLNDVRRAVEQGTRAFPDTYHVYGRAGGGPLSDAQVEDVSFFIMNWDTQALDVARGAPAQVATELTDAVLDPAEMEMKAGELVRLVVANFGSSDSVCHGQGLLGRTAAEEGAEATEQEVALDVAAGETKSLEFTPVSAGSYRFVCTPSEAGGAALEGTITVTR
jgi:mono/diheme cytochrome c family protein